MIGEYKIGRTTRRCSVENRPLEPGEYYYSVVTEGDEEFHRADISANAWNGPPEGCVGHWKNRVPLPEEKKRELAPPEVLIDILRSMEGHPAKAKMRYLLALMLLRKRALKPHESASFTNPDAQSSRESTEESFTDLDGPESEDGQNEVAETAPSRPPAEMLQLESTADGSVMAIEICAIAAGEAESLQEQLVDLLYREVE